jgi:deazaflavin-dependent oxidoreductase (nitroreductase family)
MHSESPRRSRSRRPEVGIQDPSAGVIAVAMSATREAIESSLERGHTIDITTTGRTSHRPRRLEIVFHNIDGRIYISGVPSPRRRSWIANLAADPKFTFHLKGKVAADLPATARIIDDEVERRQVLPHVARNWGRKDLEQMVRYSPLIEVTFPEATARS